ncbi:MAG TPA: hypothetical protein VHD31_02820 [Candidatus Paceibacterota bacterium]|nr:hypothetical protein [Candidatus Paceibacterota bacterium]
MLTKLSDPLTRVAVIIGACCLMLWSIAAIGNTLSAFLNQEKATANTFQAGTWEPQPLQISAAVVTFSGESFVDETSDEPPLPLEISDPIVTISGTDTIQDILPEQPLPVNDIDMPPQTPDTGTPAQTPPVEVPPTTPMPQEPTAPSAQE